ncbi:uncharacterized protein LOC110033733 isoform X1 [Phalaenopsis equestris]|uniref:uncharacterized protein LOC110033733 isoform X1 n=1 Tax=Phalaenopsis equestris TaxID=78828 RepID=UPI0009E1CB70|nr:uncharacterized protein LOC110033733 isoform X1 [Phalaenopsis equestris]
MIVHPLILDVLVRGQVMLVYTIAKPTSSQTGVDKVMIGIEFLIHLLKDDLPFVGGEPRKIGEGVNIITISKRNRIVDPDFDHAKDADAMDQRKNEGNPPHGEGKILDRQGIPSIVRDEKVTERHRESSDSLMHRLVDMEEYFARTMGYP